MAGPPKTAPRLRQATPQELTDSLLGFLRGKFYPGEGESKAFYQDRSRLLAWVVLWPASWFNNRGVTVPAETYRKIFLTVFQTAAANASDKIQYRPAWMKMVIQSHFRIHGEDYYNQAKATRSLVEHAMMMTGAARQPVQAAPDPVARMAEARGILTSQKPRKATAKPPVKDQLSLF